MGRCSLLLKRFSHPSARLVHERSVYPSSIAQLGGHTGKVSRRTLVMFLALGVLWGIPYLLIKVALDSFGPAGVVFGRTALGSLLLIPVALRQQAFGPALRHWKAVVAYAVVEVGAPWMFLSRAEQHITSGLAALLIAGVPVVGVVLAFLTGRRERLGVKGMSGLFIGLGGVAILVGRGAFAPSGPGAPGAMIEMGVVVVGYALGPLLMDRYLREVPAAGALVPSLGLVALGTAPFAMRSWPAHVSWHALLAVILLGVLCTATAFLLMFALVNEIGPVRMTTVTYLNPAVAVIAGTTFLGESFTPLMGVGFAAIVVGSYLVQRAGRPAPVEGRATAV